MLGRIKKIENEKHWILSSVFLWCLFVILATVAYLVVGISLWSSFAVAVGVGVAAWKMHWRLPKMSRVFPSAIRDKLLIGLTLGIELWLVVLLFLSRVEYSLLTPWHSTNVFFFVLFGIVVGCLLYTSRRSSVMWWIATALYGMVVYGVALVVFSLGYGYDPLIHQTAEQYVLEHGRIFPLQPMYIGQYAVVSVLSRMTGLGIELVDRLLLPLHAMLSVLLVSYYGLTRAWGMTKDHARFGMLLVPLVILPALTFTVPYNFTVLYALWWIFLLPLVNRSWLVWFLVVAALVTHPMLGVPMFLVTLAVQIGGKSKVLTSVLLAVAIGVGLLSMFGLFRLLQGETFIVNSAIVDWQNIWNVFAFPFSISDVSVFWKLLYSISYGLWWVVILTSVYFIFPGKALPKHVRLPLVGTVVGIVFAIALLRTYIVIPGVIHYEQLEFVLRLKTVLPLFVLPVFLVGIVAAWNRYVARHAVLYFLGIFIISALMAVQFYFLYPTINAVEYSQGWNVAQHDIEAVRLIDQQAQSDYVVLTDQLLAAVGLREFGFDHKVGEVHIYPISPNEKVFPFAEQVLYGRPDHALIDGLRDTISVQEVYVAIHEYWFSVDYIEYAILEAGAERVDGPGGVRIFVFK